MSYKRLLHGALLAGALASNASASFAADLELITSCHEYAITGVDFFRSVARNTTPSYPMLARFHHYYGNALLECWLSQENEAKIMCNGHFNWGFPNDTIHLEILERDTNVARVQGTYAGEPFKSELACIKDIATSL